MTYPDGRVLTMEYGSGDDEKLSRMSTLDWNGADVSTYTYLGASSIVKENYPVPTVSLDYIGSGHAYSGFDHFGRVVDQKWVGGGGNVDQFKYGYDRNSNRTYRENVVAAAQTTPVHLDELYCYDHLNRLIAAHRGELVSNDRITDHALSQTWQLDATGNWNEFANYDQATVSDVRVTIKELAEHVLAITRSESSISYVDPKTIYGESYEEANDKFPDAPRLMNMGWQPRCSLEDTIRGVYEYIRAIAPKVVIPAALR